MYYKDVLVTYVSCTLQKPSTMYYTFCITSFGMFDLYSHLHIKLEKLVFSSTFDNFGQKTINTYGEKSFASSINIILTNQI